MVNAQADALRERAVLQVVPYLGLHDKPEISTGHHHTLLFRAI